MRDTRAKLHGLVNTKLPPRCLPEAATREISIGKEVYSRIEHWRSWVEKLYSDNERLDSDIAKLQDSLTEANRNTHNWREAWLAKQKEVNTLHEQLTDALEEIVRLKRELSSFCEVHRN